MLTLLGPLNLISKIAGGFLIGLCLLLYISLKVEQRGHAKAKVQITKLVAAREADRRAYTEAQRKAAELNRAQVEAENRTRKAISDATTVDLNARLELLRRELRKANAAPASASRPTGSSGVPQAAPGTDGEAWVCRSPSDFLRLAENEERHDQLIRWVEQQLQVNRAPTQ